MPSLFTRRLRLVRPGLIFCLVVARLCAADSPPAAAARTGFIYRLTTTDRQIIHRMTT